MKVYFKALPIKMAHCSTVRQCWTSKWKRKWANKGSSAKLVNIYMQLNKELILIASRTSRSLIPTNDIWAGSWFYSEVPAVLGDLHRLRRRPQQDPVWPTHQTSYWLHSLVVVATRLLSSTHKRPTGQSESIVFETAHKCCATTESSTKQRPGPKKTQ